MTSVPWLDKEQEICQDPILWPPSHLRGVPGQKSGPALAGCAPITSSEGKPFVWEEMVQNEQWPRFK